MEIKSEVKEGDKTAEWRARSNAEIEKAEEKSTINTFNIVGTLIVILGIVIGLATSWSVMLTNVSLGIIIIGIGEILRYLNKIANKAK
ncbi:hypothetical protein [Paenibacillus sinopodophylli]|uniref:hypothetical protein n=1 Tax=Paenibacillus sinopodophylli TaxID=1837342 RepID=UPI00110CABCD|nr:hypothetical protein [Paenibacillus sinopodophylli]